MFNGQLNALTDPNIAPPAPALVPKSVPIAISLISVNGQACSFPIFLNLKLGVFHNFCPFAPVYTQTTSFYTTTFFKILPLSPTLFLFYLLPTALQHSPNLSVSLFIDYCYITLSGDATFLPNVSQGLPFLEYKFNYWGLPVLHDLPLNLLPSCLIHFPIMYYSYTNLQSY